jgi:hypothetical protein
MTILRRAQIRPGVQGIDTTVKSAHGIWRAFAPTWDMVMNHKARTISDAQYTERYVRILDQVPTSVWDQLATQPAQIVLCYCRETIFCHTHLLIEYAITHWPDRFSDERPTPVITPRLF